MAFPSSTLAVSHGTSQTPQRPRTRLALPRNAQRADFHRHEFTADVPCNQIPKATAELALRSPLLGASVRAPLRRALEGFAAVTSIAVDRTRFAAAMTDRLSEAY